MHPGMHPKMHPGMHKKPVLLPIDDRRTTSDDRHGHVVTSDGVWWASHFGADGGGLEVVRSAGYFRKRWW